MESRHTTRGREPSADLYQRKDAELSSSDFLKKEKGATNQGLSCVLVDGSCIAVGLRGLDARERLNHLWLIQALQTPCRPTTHSP